MPIYIVGHKYDTSAPHDSYALKSLYTAARDVTCMHRTEHNHSANMPSSHADISSSETVTSSQSNLTTGRIAAAHGRLNGIRQVALLKI